MLNFKYGRPIAKIVGGKSNGKIIKIHDTGVNYPCCESCNEKCIAKKKKCCSNCEMSKTNNLCSGGKKNKKATDYGRVEISLIDGNICPMPNPETNPDGSFMEDCTFVAGPQGSGKSTIISKMIEQEKEIHPRKDVIIFSNFDKDKPLDAFKPIRVKIDDEMVKDPIKKEECKNSICVFDDIDTIRPETLAKACQALRDDFLQCGRKENIKVFATSHQIMNYKKTRDLLNSCSKIIIFPRATSQHHMKRLLEMYLGLDKNSVKYLLKLPTRWLLINKTYPQYVLYETGAIMLNELPNILDNQKSKKGGLKKFDDMDLPNGLKLRLMKLGFDPESGDRLSKNKKGIIRDDDYIKMYDSEEEELSD
jgi:AAA domain-containing protein